MGNEQSKNSGYEIPDQDGQFASSTYVRLDGNRQSDYIEEPVHTTKATYRGTTVKMAFSGVWSIMNPIGTNPEPRSGHFTVFSPETRTAFIGYGTKGSGEYLDDVWALNLNNNSWRRLQLNGDPVSPRSGAVAVMLRQFIVVFGGVANDNYFGELHTIDTMTGNVIITKTNGVPPVNRANCVMGLYNQHIYIWGGFNGSYPTDLSILDFDSMTWRTAPAGTEGRPNAPHVQFNDHIYLYGDSKTNGLVVVDMSDETVMTPQLFGTPPSAEIINAGMVRCGGYLFFFGGQSKNKWSMIYACDIEKRWWFAFFVDPDGYTTTTADGRLSSDGLFLIPQISGFSAIYDDKKRQILAFLGNPKRSPVQLSVISIGNALGFLHLREDMRRMFEMSG